LSFALGSLGFLTKFDYESYPETLTRLFRDGVTVSLKFRLEGTIMRAQRKKDDAIGDLVEELVGDECDDNRTHKPDGSHEVLNEIVVDRGPNASEQTSRIDVFKRWEADETQPYPRSSCSATTSTSLPSRPMASV
jgi:NAD+ kinase